ncbi:FAD-dependent oxidoreductase [Nocardia sp. CDC153]|uniref:FAD-dependent oxidoreductase n=1 Tax=Nocardia sp. CDC153 TaxID=3112167 RepID=UPI002DB91AFA|nr:FAD-dependent oxidoreductase [Nocardia sp. CDC153]MEC3956336.1 FAD-dependent oxidoreductase [Nocardia sp. CDC153]
MNETRDVVVVGAGPVGLMLACELRLAGVDVLVVERLTAPDPTIKAGGINAPVAQALDRRGLEPSLRAAHDAAMARMMELFAKPKTPAGPATSAVPTAPAAPMRPRAGGHFAGIMLSADRIDTEDPAFADLGPAAESRFVDQQALEAMLAARATELGVPVRRGVEVSGFDDDGIGVSVDCGEHRVRASWLVGCDGGRSTVRKLAGFEFPGLDPEIAGRQAVVEMTGAEDVPRGWNTTPTGIYVYGPTPGRILTVELDGPPADRVTPVTAAELEASFERVTGVKVQISKVISATRFTDNTRQVPDYRKGRVLLAGDAAHVHSPFGGQGLNLGIGDAANLGWKLAAVIRGRAPETLLDTYSRERHPIGAWVLEWTRAQVALMRTDPRSRALRSVVTELLDTPDAATLIAKRLAGVLHRYDLGSDDPLVGTATPDFDLADGTRLADHFTSGKAVLLDLTDSPALRATAAPWSDRVEILTTKPAQPREPLSLLIRPDGIIAWTSAAPHALDGALSTWFGQPD